jgi:hypothetical protein
MEKAGFHSRGPDPDAFVARTRVLPFLHVSTGLSPLDLVLAGPGIEDTFIQRAIRVEIEGPAVPVVEQALGRSDLLPLLESELERAGS